MILKEGQIIDNRWHVVYLIKENLYAESYRVEDESGNPYFLKIYRLKDTPDKLIVDGAVTEITISRQLNHKNIVSHIHDGVLKDEAGDCQYMVASYFTGELLSEMIQREGKLDKETAVRIFMEMLQGLQYFGAESSGTGGKIQLNCGCTLKKGNGHGSKSCARFFMLYAVLFRGLLLSKRKRIWRFRSLTLLANCGSMQIEQMFHK